MFGSGWWPPGIGEKNTLSACMHRAGENRRVRPRELRSVDEDASTGDQHVVTKKEK